MTFKEKYHKYLKSDQWACMKIELLTIRGSICEVCGDKKPAHLLDMHHITYDNLFEEEPEDLQLLCKKHHMQEHGLWEKFIANYINKKRKPKKKNKKSKWMHKDTPKDKDPYRYEKRRRRKPKCFAEVQSTKPKRFKRAGKELLYLKVSI